MGVHRAKKRKGVEDEGVKKEREREREKRRKKKKKGRGQKETERNIAFRIMRVPRSVFKSFRIFFN